MIGFVNILSLPTRFDRRLSISENLNRFGIDYKIFDASKLLGVEPFRPLMPINIYSDFEAIAGNVNGFIKILEENRYSITPIFYFEDDALIVKEGLDYFLRHKEFIPEDYDIFYLSGRDVDHPEPINKYVFHPTYTTGTHSLMINPKSIEKIINLFYRRINDYGYDFIDQMIIKGMCKDLNLYKFMCDIGDTIISYSDLQKRIIDWSQYKLFWNHIPDRDFNINPQYISCSYGIDKPITIYKYLKEYINL